MPRRTQTDPPKCPAGGGGCTLPDGGTQINDDWMPAIAINDIPGTSTPQLAWYFYGTQDQDNTRVQVFMNTMLAWGPPPPPNPTLITSGAFPMDGTNFWTVSGSQDVLDYQLMGSSWHNGSFLPFWASDGRGSREVIPNGGFELGTFSMWTKSWLSTITTASAHSGTYAAQLSSSVPTAGNSVIKQGSLGTPLVAPLHATTFSFWFNQHCSGVVANDWLTAALTDYDTSSTTTILSNTCTNGSGWQQILAPAIATHRYSIAITSHDDGVTSNYAYLDDVTFGGAGPAMVSDVLQ